MKMDWINDYFDETYAKYFLEPVDEERTSSQVAFIENILGISPPCEVADFCCGIGRHTVEFAKRGYLSVGYDFNDYYINRASQQALDCGLVSAFFFKQDMRNFQEEGLFDVACCLWVSFGYFDDDTNRDIFFRMVRSLRSGGKFFMDLENREYILKNFIHEKWRTKDEAVILERNKFDPETSRIKCNRTIIENGTKKIYTRHVRMYTATEIIQLAKASGLQEIKLLGDWDGKPYGLQTQRMILTGRLP